MATLIRAAALTNYAEIARQLGLNPLAMLRKARLSAVALGDPEHRVPLAAVLALLEESARRSHCPTFGLRMAESRKFADLGAMSLLLSHQRTLREALQTVIRYRHLLNQSLAIHVEEAGEVVILRVELVADRAAPARQGIELAMGVLFRMCATLLGTAWRPYSVTFTHDTPPDLEVHRRVFGAARGCELEFGSEFNGIICAAADLDRPNPAADPAMARYARRFIESLPRAEEHSIILEVRRAIYLLLPMGRASISQVAEGLGVNPRTLQRQLDESGETFSDLLNTVRRELVLRYMDNRSYSLARVAGLLGYSAPSSFTRWFTTEFGAAPAQWRRRNRHAPARRPKGRTRSAGRGPR